MDSNTSQTLTLDAMARLTPKFAEVTEQVLFGDIWQRPGLSPRDRSLITVAALIALNRSEQLPFHLSLAVKNGVTQAGLSEMITHLAFYAGWPAAASALTRFASLNDQ
ncbi:MULTISPECIES: carboxymuconolactone decarboxylase family protein [Rahnella]|jgi:4-carboxymuconolactone decarboxylase|uniref:Carboxymuconolactone decarboxylase family protein n=1 Tax=Rahnella victoriana TaxID=1510570 RepID=A0ABS0DUI1_9GAMM|nr:MULTISPECIES: carboxymuconolactone decarboxylase family protein [Rahnella]VTQ59353.1 4-carboxymuconolactone decarboxylase [Campylobacter jejuni]MBF7956637.1 carboxymuconolactone decarboxylase family protein [Rahnella victoriana]PBI80055.1 4-carboxymuconolactone decarboxylase [Rahnella victoriana]TBX32688.1 carboxymuconolactone decarboxylase family protein [Rahnella victoriana]TDS95833.1 4-carboxymuconolactone decarboxylase [Rahnella sp. BIGb0236]